VERIDAHPRCSRVNGQQPQEVAAHDLGLLLRRHFAIEQGIVLGDADVHQGKGGIAAERDSARTEGFDRVEHGRAQNDAPDQQVASIFPVAWPPQGKAKKDPPERFFARSAIFLLTYTTL
jgi:hypothetical protein